MELLRRVSGAREVCYRSVDDHGFIVVFFTNTTAAIDELLHTVGRLPTCLREKLALEGFVNIVVLDRVFAEEGGLCRCRCL